MRHLLFALLALTACTDDPLTAAVPRDGDCAAGVRYDGVRLVFADDAHLRATHACLAVGGADAVSAFEASFRGFRSRRAAVGDGGGDAALLAMLDARSEVVIGASAWTIEIEQPRGATREARAVPAPLGRVSLIQSSFGTVGNFELVAARLDGDGGLQHYYRRNDLSLHPWIIGQTFGLGYHYSGVSLVQSAYGLEGNFEVLASLDGFLGIEHFYRDNDAIGPFSSTGVFGGEYSYADVELIAGSNGDLYAVAAIEGGGLRTFHRLWDGVWQKSFPIDPDRSYVAVSMFESHADTLEIVAAPAAGSLVHLRATLGSYGALSHVATIGSDRYRDVSLFQSTFGLDGNFELASVHDDGFVQTWWRDTTWHVSDTVAADTRSASMIQSTFGGGFGNFELVTALPWLEFRHDYRDNDVMPPTPYLWYQTVP